MRSYFPVNCPQANTYKGLVQSPCAVPHKKNLFLFSQGPALLIKHQSCRLHRKAGWHLRNTWKEQRYTILTSKANQIFVSNYILLWNGLMNTIVSVTQLFWFWHFLLKQKCGVVHIRDCVFFFPFFFIASSLTSSRHKTYRAISSSILRNLA